MNKNTKKRIKKYQNKPHQQTNQNNQHHES